MGLFGRKNQFPLSGRTILITGGSQGMGKSLAKISARKGANVIIVARNVKKLQTALEEISSQASSPESQRFHYISADLTSSDENTRILDEATKWNNGNPPDIVWANAGSAYPHLFIETPIEKLREQMDIDYWASAYLAHATLRLWTKQHPEDKTAAKEVHPRQLIMTSSVCAFIAIAGYGAYGPAKSAMRNLADTLRHELQIYNGARKHKTNPLRVPEIKNHIVFPGGILSPGFEEENKVKHPVTVLLEADDKPQTEDEVATSAIAGLEKGHYLITTALLGSLMKATALGGSVRNGWGLVDMATSLLATIVWAFVGPDLESKVFKWGRDNGADKAVIH